jgi:transposase
MDAPREDESESTGDELKEAKKRAAVLLAQGLRNKEVGQLVGRDEHTIARWKQEPAFNAAVKAAGEAMDARVQADRSQFISDLNKLKGDALSALRELLHEQDATIRLKAAEAILKV